MEELIAGCLLIGLNFNSKWRHLNRDVFYFKRVGF